MDAVITNITNNFVEIACNDGKVRKIKLYDMNFRPVVGQNVEVYEENNQLYVINKKVESKVEEESLLSDGGQEVQEISNENIQYIYAQPVPLYDAFGRKRVNKVAYCILAFLLGGFGIHKFYSGKIAKGIVYILFCWTLIPSIIAFVEMIIAMTKQADAYGNIYI